MHVVDPLALVSLGLLARRFAGKNAPLDVCWLQLEPQLSGSKGQQRVVMTSGCSIAKGKYRTAARESKEKL